MHVKCMNRSRALILKLLNFVSYVCHIVTVNVLCFQDWPPGIECQICHMTFSDQSAISNLKTHLSSVHRQGDVTEFQCDICCKVFVIKGRYDGHMATVHGVGDYKRFPCNVCGKVLREKSILNEHMVSVHDIGDRTELTCKICSLVVASKRSLTRHMDRLHPSR